MKSSLFLFFLWLCLFAAAQDGPSGKTSSEEAFENTLLANADHFFSLLGKSQMHYLNNEWDSTIFYSMEAHNYYASNPLPSTDLFYEARDAHFRQQILFIDKMIPYNRQNTMLLVTRANFNVALKNYKQAISDCSRAIAIDPDDFGVLFSRGYAYLLLRDHKKAIKDFSRCLLLQPDNPSAILNRGYALMEAEKYSAAVKDFLFSVKLNTSNTENAYGMNNIGYCYYKLKEYDKAESYILESIEMLPHNPYAYRNLALINIALGKKEQACSHIDKSISLGAAEEFGNEIFKLKKAHCK